MHASPLRRMRSHRYFPPTVLALTVLLASFIHVWQRVHVLELVNENSVLRSERAIFLDELKKTNSDISALSMSSRIRAYAGDTLGMRLPATDHVFILMDSKQRMRPSGEFDRMADAFKRFAAYLPSISETRAHAGEVDGLNLDSSLITGRNH